MSILTVLIVLIIVGVLLYLVNEFIPLDPKIKKLINIVVVILLIIWLLRVVGAFNYLEKVQV